MRAVLIDWLVDVHHRFKMIPQTFFMAINLIDRYLEQVPVARGRLQLIGLASLFLAAKYEEIYPPDLKDYVHICDSTYDEKSIIEIEGHMLCVLQFDLVFSSSFHFYEMFSKHCNFFPHSKNNSECE